MLLAVFIPLATGTMQIFDANGTAHSLQCETCALLGHVYIESDAVYILHTEDMEFDLILSCHELFTSPLLPNEYTGHENQKQATLHSTSSNRKMCEIRFETY